MACPSLWPPSGLMLCASLPPNHRHPTPSPPTDDGYYIAFIKAMQSPESQALASALQNPGPVPQELQNFYTVVQGTGPDDVWQVRAPRERAWRCRAEVAAAAAAALALPALLWCRPALLHAALTGSSGTANTAGAVRLVLCGAAGSRAARHG